MRAGFCAFLAAGAKALVHDAADGARATPALRTATQAAIDLVGCGRPGRRVIEVIPRDHPKGDMLEAMIEMRRPLGIICIGDDENDRPMFELVASLRLPHLTIGVASSEAAPDLFASCDLVVSDPQEVSRFLTIVAEWAERTNS